MRQETNYFFINEKIELDSEHRKTELDCNYNVID
jgi:hypothetical protein